jgi:hypothetical protein
LLAAVGGIAAPRSLTHGVAVMRTALLLLVAFAMIIVEGVLVGSNDLNAKDIEKVEIIKGPAATASDGKLQHCPAIVITTRRTREASRSHPAPRKEKPGASARPE